MYVYMLQNCFFHETLENARKNIEFFDLQKHCIWLDSSFSRFEDWSFKSLIYIIF